MKNSHKSWLIAFTSIIVGLIVYIVMIIPLQKNYYARHVNIHGIYFLNPIKIENIELIDQNNKPFTIDRLKNHWSLLFFGFTHCDIVCPVTLSTLNQFYQSIEKILPEKDMPQIIFITIDPENDTTARLKKYLAQFNSHFIGARTSIEKTISLKKQFYIFAEKIPSNKKFAQYNHTSDILLINPNAEIQAYFDFPPDSLRLVKDYMAILKYANKSN